MKQVSSLDAYQAHANLTAKHYDSPEKALLIAALDIAGEAGEVADYIKKVVGHGHQLEDEKLILELGDVLWGVQRMATLIHVPFSEVAQKNLDKLAKRYSGGFSTEASIARTDVM